MNKTDLISLVVEKTELNKKDVEKVVSAVLKSIEGAMANGEKVQLVGFGTFDSKPRKAREGRNPQTGETIHIAATRVPVFKPGKLLKDAMAALTI